MDVMLKWMRKWAPVVDMICGLIMTVLAVAPAIGAPRSQEIVDQPLTPRPVEQPAPLDSGGGSTRAGSGDSPEVSFAGQPPFTSGPTFDGVGFRGQLFMMQQDYVWGLGQEGSPLAERQSTQIYFDDQPAELEELQGHMNGFVGLMGQATDLVAVGMSSCMGEDKRHELRRGAKRAARLSSMLSKAYPEGRRIGTLNIWSLNLGQFNCTGPEQDRPDQRRVVILALRRAPGICLGSHDLQETMREFGVLKLDVAQYSTFDLHPELFDDDCNRGLVADL